MFTAILKVLCPAPRGPQPILEGPQPILEGRVYVLDLPGIGEGKAVLKK